MNKTDSTNKSQRAILRAAEKEFLDKGLAGARISAIAEEAGVTHAMLHYYFRTKEALFQHIIHEKQTELLDSLTEALTSSVDTDIFTKVRSVVEKQFDFFMTNPSLPKLMINEIAPNPDKFEAFFMTANKFLVEVMSSFDKELRKATSRGEIAEIGFYDLMIDIISLNVFSAILIDSISAITGMSKEEIFEKRRKENVETIMKRLKP